MTTHSSATPEIITLPWQQDALQYYSAALSHKPWTMLLHSGFAQHAYSRFDILVADPVITLQTCGKVTKIREPHQLRSVSGDPLCLLQDCMKHYPPLLPASSELPFLGGAVGLFGYDLARQFEKLPATSLADLTTPDMAVGIYDWALIADQQNKQLSLVSLSNAAQRLAWLKAQTRQTTAPFKLTSHWQSNMTRKQYGEKFRQIQQYLLAGDCYQVNLAQRFHASYSGDEWQAFTRLNAACRAPFSAFLRLEHQAILSLSPERFLLLQQGNIQTRPIKGTLPRLGNPADDAQQARRLADSTKDRAENLMIVDLLRNDIGRVALPGSVRVPELFVVEQFPAVHHLVSTVSGQLPASKHPCDLLRACFPGGSITGAPKIRAMEIIEQLEPVRRNAWCGSIGYISFCGNMDSNITIRTLIAQNGMLYCSAGGGIVCDSDEQGEYLETLAKVEAMLRLLTDENHTLFPDAKHLSDTLSATASASHHCGQ